MRTIFVIALCAIFTCHAASGKPRQKRTLRMLESLMDRMRETFGPAPIQRSISQPDVILTSKYPVGVKYMYYPTVRMHIRPVQPPAVTKHIIYVKPVPAPIPAPIIRPAMHMPKGNVEIIRHIRPIVRLPKTKTTTTITYEIIPLPIPMQSNAPLIDHEDESRVPWSMDALPPPVPTSNPTTPAEEQDVPWNLQALPPPVATKSTRLQEDSEWYPEPEQPDINSAYLIPVVKKKLMIPAQGPKSRYGHVAHQKPFRPSPLHSEISVQPSIEVASFTEIEPAGHHSRDYFNRLNDRRPQTFDNGKERFRRDLNMYAQAESTTKNFSGSVPGKLSSYLFPYSGSYFSAQSRPFVESPKLADASKNLEKVLQSKEPQVGFPYSIRTNEKHPALDSFSPLQGLPTFDSYKPYPDVRSSTLDFGEYVDNEDADKADDIPAASSVANYTDQSVTAVRATDWLTATTPQPYVAITPKPLNYDGISANAAKKAESSLNQDTIGKNPSFSENFRNLKLIEDGVRSQRDSTTFFDSSKTTLRFPDTSLLSKFPRKQNDYGGKFSKTDVSFSELFPAPKNSKFFDNREGDFQRFDYDNIEYFEPIIIDIDKEKQRSDTDSKLKFKYKNFGKKNADDPLRLPDSLHETIDYLQKTLMHPPIFDLEGEANEPRFVAVMNENEIT